MKIINILFIVFFLTLSGCNSFKEDDDNLIKRPEIVPPVNKLYSDAIREYNAGKSRGALKLFQLIETNYSYSNFAPKSKIFSIFIYFENSDYYNSLKYAEQFKKIYPLDKNTDYVDFIIALNFYEQVQTQSRDQTYTIAAKKKFNEIIKKYPQDNKYVLESKYKIDLLNEQLAGKQIYIARFYMNKSKWIPAIKRLNIVINDYPTTIYSIEALHRLVEIYYKLGNLKLAKKYASILGYNFNDSEWYKKTYKLVGDKNYKEINKKSKISIRDKLKKFLPKK